MRSTPDNPFNSYDYSEVGHSACEKIIRDYPRAEEWLFGFIEDLERDPFSRGVTLSVFEEAPNRHFRVERSPRVVALPALRVLFEVTSKASGGYRTIIWHASVVDSVF
jgi:hypothetical protein